ncbi:hypothetical protein [Micromonospora sp. NBS 11-29]|uniref:hypothetical protein n=1 Tax=Micromonospora sp. NBS 11-29 TaxID=1960879 RepID=UPI0020CC4426|nr:hypothetical protein [Micromonospora sp. NBS 11-29]
MLTRGGADTPARRRWFAAGLAALLTLAVTPARAAADPGGSCTPDQVDCDVWDDDPGIPGGGPGGPGGGGGSGNGGAAPKCQWNGRAIPCHDDVLGWFNNADGCYYKLASAQADAPPGKQWYQLTCNGGDLGSMRQELLDGPPDGYGAPPDPEELARRALASISLLPPRASVAPRRSKGPGLVGLPVWMWASRGASYFGPLTASASDRGLTVTITANVTRTVWHMDRNLDVECAGPGTPYRANGPLAGSASPDCGLPNGYPKAGIYQVYATTFWTVEWTSSGGERGVIAQSRESGVIPVQINERQVVTR